MKTERIYPYYFTLALLWLFALPVLYAVDWPFKIVPLAFFVTIVWLSLRVMFKRRPCGHGLVTMNGMFCYPWVPRKCPKCGAKVW